ncbi:hypothetical protein ECP03023084_2891 [Escherichia coli P0302308.4]|nr:hypothetical protein ECP03023083_3072 [Escherichia coli P0302308.3]END25405.1 hypothetical protein ECP03023084_2891 [Escherichia coli P0302308.4]
MISIIASSAPGLSPLARGTPETSWLVVLLWRFIPAGAGNTLVLNRPALETPVYPRWRGEHLLKKKAPALSVGLSPLARGTLVNF